MCNIFTAAYKPKMGIHVENDGPILRAHDLPRQELLFSCVHNIDTDTPKTTARFDVQHISNRSDVSRVLSLTAAADAHMQSWTAVILDRKREKTAVRFDVHISETKTRPC